MSNGEYNLVAGLWDDATGWIYNAATGKLTNAQKQAIIDQSTADIRAATVGNPDLGDAQVAQLNKDLASTFAQSDAQADAGSLFGIGGLAGLGDAAKKYLPWVIAAILAIVFGPTLLGALLSRRR